MEKIIVTTLGAILIAFIYWFFFGKKEEIVEVKNGLQIVVDGGYKPGIIRVKKGQVTKLTFIRKDSNSCLEEVVFPDLKIREYLPMDQKIEISLNPQKTGTYDFHCGMGMFHGKLVVE